MQFQSIIAVLSFALVVTAVPTSPPSGGTVCQAGATAAACNSAPKQGGQTIGSLLSLLDGLSVGLGNVLSCVAVIPVASGNQQAVNACCNTSGAQTGVINVGTVCVPVTA
ncbi:hypothetical protein MMC22_005382 [Lobaria immixta]|nr:hypothetical protein [Lobaria immixta]